ncbi:MAG: type II toxin-antitoxin system RelE/ParE family toxin [Pyrinomonadaceae bacterium]
MPTEEIYVGARFTVRGWVENGTCLVFEFLDELEANGDSDYKRLNYLINRMADNGVILNKKHVRPLDDKIYEFKAPNTARILFFYDKGSLIICSHGFSGKSGNEQKFIQKQIKKATSIRDDYFKEVGEEK